MELNERKLKILKSIIDEYIDHGEPVGSKHLLQHGSFSLSSATIRNEMSDLEQMGYLDKPHASAGRVPSGSAYRLYVEELMKEYKQSTEQLDLLGELTRFKANEVDKIVTKARKIMSKMTNYASLTVEENVGECVVERFDALLISSSGMLLVMVMPDGSVNTKHINTGIAINDADVAIIKNALNFSLAGKPLGGVSLPEIMQLEEQFGSLRSLVNPLLRIAYEAAAGSDGKSVEVDGITNLLAYPEFKNVERVKDLLGLLEPDSGNIKDLLPAVSSSSADSKLKVYIGDDDDASGLSDASIVFCSLPVGKKNTIFGILGPRRMDYKKATTALTRLSQTMQSLSDRADNTIDSIDNNDNMSQHTDDR